MRLRKVRMKVRLWRSGVIIWGPSNIYYEAKIGRNVSIGAFTEIGPHVEIGNNVRIGAMCFIPEGVIIEDNAWIGPRCTFTNDMYPPSPREEWCRTVISCGARLGAAVTVIPGVTIGPFALIGAGSVVTRNVPSREVWAGVPAMKLDSKGKCRLNRDLGRGLE